MPFITNIMNLYFTKRRREIDNFMKDPHGIQSQQLEYLLSKGKDTEYGKRFGMDNISSFEQFQKNTPVSDYDSFEQYILDTKDGGKNILWPSEIKWFAKSSGTTGSKSKYIPVSDEGLWDSHMQGPRDVLALFCDAYPKSNAFSGKTLTLGGSKKIEKEGESAFSGDLSAILIENTPAWASIKRVPSAETALLPDFEEKVKRICEETVDKDIRCFAGVPSWNLVMLNKVLEYTGKSNLLEVWPNLELFIHGGMNFKPYAEQYREIIPSPDMKYMETYNASEGFFSIADDPAKDDMLLMLDYKIFYEFIPLDSLGDHSKAVPLEGVITGVNYAMLITTSNGLWRYMIGDTVEFTSISPYRIRITGRTKHYINAFGEEVVIENAENAIREACDHCGAEVFEYSVAPVYMEGQDKGAHEWVIEFSRKPADIVKFSGILDKALQNVNSDYEAKRFKNTTLNAPRVSIVPEGTFLKWMRDQGKTGGQNKVPRLYNDRRYVDQLLETAKELDAIPA